MLRARTAASSATAGSEEFKTAMRAMAGTVVMLTTWIDDRPWGLTITACCSISADPPKLLVSVGKNCAARSALIAGGGFGVSILHAEQRGVAELGARAGVSKFIDHHHDPTASAAGSPVVVGAISHLDCRLSEWWDVEDHTIAVARVQRIFNRHHERGGEPNPLLYLDRAYRTVGAPVGVPSASEEGERE